MEKILRLQKLEQNGYKTILKFRVNQNGKGEFFEANQGMGEGYAKLLQKSGLQIGKISINPIEQPKKFMELAPKYDSSSYLRWV